MARTAVSIREKDIAGRCINAGAVAHNGGEAGRGKEQDKSSYDQIGERRTSADDKAQRGRLTSKEGKGDEGSTQWKTGIDAQKIEGHVGQTQTVNTITLIYTFCIAI